MRHERCGRLFLYHPGLPGSHKQEGTMGHLAPPKGAVAHLLYFDDFSHRYRLKPAYTMALWALGAFLLVRWVVAVW
jgi:hypothetical protein